MKNKRKRISIELSGLVCVIMTISLFLVSFISLSSTKNLLKEQLKYLGTQILGQVDDIVYGYVDNMIIQLDLLMNDSDIKYLNSVEEDYYNKAASIQNTFTTLCETIEGLENIYYADEYSENIIFAEDIWSREKVDFISNSDWYIAAKDNPEEYYYTEPYIDEIKGNIVLTISKAVKDDSGNFLGTLAVDLNMSKVDDYVADISLMDSGNIIITDNEGRIITKNGEITHDENYVIQLEGWEKVAADNNGYYSAEINGTDAYVVYNTDDRTEWKYIAIINENEINKSFSSVRKIMVVTSVLCLSISLSATIALIGKIIKNISKINDVVRRLGEGDFTTKADVKSNNEIGELADNINKSIDNISELVRSVEVTANEMYDASNNIASMSEETKASVSEVSNAMDGVASGAADQAHSVNSGMVSVNNLAASIKDVEQNSIHIAEASKEAEKLSNEGLEALNMLIEKSEITKKNTNESADAVNLMVGSINKINFISDAIADITDQTNLLALNASIEAARAGEAGKGFAVVAEEIRKLAEESKVSTDEIKEIISDIVKNSDATTTSMNESIRMLAEQDKSVVSTKSIFNKIVESIHNLIAAVEQINNSIVTMDNDKEVVVTGMATLENTTQEIASVSEEVMASTQEVCATMNELTEYTDNLNLIAEELKQQLDRFEL